MSIDNNINFNNAVFVVLESEGVFSDDEYDSGGKTKYGITEEEAIKNGYSGKMEDMTKSFAINIYKSEYWDALFLDSFDYITSLILFDTGVNMGVDMSSKFFQRSLNAMNRNSHDWNDLKVDGKIGLKTVKAYYKCKSKRSLDVIQLSIIGLRICKYIKICEMDNNQEKFFNGWMNRVSNLVKMIV